MKNITGQLDYKIFKRSQKYIHNQVNRQLYNQIFNQTWNQIHVQITYQIYRLTRNKIREVEL
jgi:hypothetical protein